MFIYGFNGDNFIFESMFETQTVFYILVFIIDSMQHI